MTKIVWDEAKRKATLASRGLDFSSITEEFFLSARIEPAKAGRFLAVGLIHDQAYCVIFAMLGVEAISIISFRHASRKERRSLW